MRGRQSTAICSSSRATTSDRCHWVKRTELLRETFPAGDLLRLVQTRPASRAAHDQLVALGFEGSVLKRPGSTYRPGRQTTWRKYKASHRATATLRAATGTRRRVTTLCSPRLAALLGHQVELVYSRVDADGSLREARISAVDVSHTQTIDHATPAHPALLVLSLATTLRRRRQGIC